jgi:hypothetical protein
VTVSELFAASLRQRAPAARACGAINDPGMIERRARLNEVANEPDTRLGRSATDYSRPAAQLAEARAERDESEAQKAALAEVLVVINSSPGDLAPVFDEVLE